MTEKKKNDIQEMNFEAAFTALQENVARLEEEDLPLDESLALFERGQELAKRCAALLEEAELKVRRLSMDADAPLEGED
ncbi:MAG: exodeoxyribonuclease VII small subunit [Chloroflexota bacterium]|jgi:exodeoxyribonuclease VII small subunit|nr:exodeoxyribonuclease VII small subunit [Chloroflexota bacterium]